MDPRFRQRRVEVARRQGRRRLRFLLGSMTVATALTATVGATRSSLLDVDRVDVTGVARTPAADVVRATGLDRAPLMVEVDTAGVARRVESLPWVLRAGAERRWPGTVSIRVIERVPAAAVAAEGGGWALVDGTGRVLALGAERPGGLPALADLPPAGPPGQVLDPAAAGPLRVAAALPEPLRARVTEVSMSAGDQVVLRLDAAAVVRLGPPDPLEPKLTAVLTLLDKADLTVVAVLDVRVPEAPVLTRR